MTGKKLTHVVTIALTVSERVAARRGRIAQNCFVGANPATAKRRHALLSWKTSPFVSIIFAQPTAGPGPPDRRGCNDPAMNIQRCGGLAERASIRKR